MQHIFTPLEQAFSKKELFIHILLWGVYYLINIGAAYSSGYFVPLLPLLLLPFLFIEIAYFYLCTLFGLKSLIDNSNREWYMQIVFVSVYLALYTSYYRYYDNELNGEAGSMSFALNVSFYSLLFDLMVVLGVVYYKYSLIRLKEIADKEVQIAKRKEVLAQQELNEFKNIFNSHITYNTLQHIYAKVLHDPEINKPTILLADFLRYSIDKHPEDKVSLEMEIQHIRNFIDIHKLISPNLQIEFKVSGSIQDVYLLGRVLINYIENALKHGVRNNPDFPISIHLYVEDQIQLKVYNKTRKSFIKRNGGTGSMITQKALSSYYEDKFCLDIRQSENEYEVHLSIPCQTKTTQQQQVPYLDN